MGGVRRGSESKWMVLGLKEFMLWSSVCVPWTAHPPPPFTCIGGSANTELGKANQLHFVGDFCVITAGCLRGGRGGTHQRGQGGASQLPKTELILRTLRSGERHGAEWSWHWTDAEPEGEAYVSLCGSCPQPPCSWGWMEHLKELINVKQ